MRSSPASLATQLLTTTGFVILFAVSMLLGRLTIVDGANLSLAWPAAGVAVLWAATVRRSSTRTLDLAALTAVIFVVDMLTGTSAWLAACFVLANVLQVVVFGLTMRRTAPELWTMAGTGHQTTNRDFGALVLAALLAGATGAAIGPTAAAALSADWSWSDLLVWLTRNTSSILLIFPAGLLISQWVQQRYRSSSRPAGQHSGVRILELAALVTASTGLYVLVFYLLDGLPLAFPLMIVTMWSALRFGTVVTALHSLGTATLAVAFTRAGHGPFATIWDGVTQAMVVQLFNGLVAVVGLTLAFGRAERTTLIRQVREQAGSALAHAENVQVLARVSRAVFGAAEPRGAICNAALEITGGDGAYIFELDPAGNLASTAAATTAGEADRLPAVNIDLTSPDSATARAFRSNTQMFISDLPHQEGTRLSIVKALGCQSAVWQPLFEHGKEIATGMLVVFWRERLMEFPAGVGAMLETVAAEAAVSIERADLLVLLAEAAEQDFLTGLPNRRSWDTYAAKEIARAERTRSPLAFALVDLDHFKAYNDTRGHLAGDTLLREFAQAAGGALRENDSLARWGGEEFVACLPNCSAEEAVVVADRLRACVPDGQTCTIGVAEWAPGINVTDLLQQADAALYRGKASGRDTVVVAEQVPQPH